MKKYTSASLLALRLSWKTAALVMILGALVQTAAMAAQLMPGGVPLQVNFSFSSIVQTSVQTPGLTAGAVLVLLLCHRAGATRGSKTIYTMKRLSLSEFGAAMVFGLVFAGYFLLYWALQLGLCFGWFVWYSNCTLVSSNALMLAVWDCDWFHFLLPLSEGFGYLRNTVICLSLGFGAAFGSCRVRRGKVPFAAGLPCLGVLFLFPYGLANTSDYFLVPILGIITVLDALALMGGLPNEEAL